MRRVPSARPSGVVCRVLACGLLAASTACDDSSTQATESTQPEEAALPQPTQDRVGLPANYATTFRPFYVFDRPDNRQVRVVYANPTAMAGKPFANGSILVMETYRAKLDAQGVPTVGADGRYERDALAGIFVMRKERGFGRRYGENQSGDWEYASFRADKTANVVGDAAGVGCALCHIDAGPQRDWVYRANIPFAGASGAPPKPAANQAANQPLLNNYAFVPATITVAPGTSVTWTNQDQVKHTVTARDGSFSAFVSQGQTFSRTFPTAGTFEVFCAVHPTMRTTVIVQR
jgi:plastocyanin